MKLFRLMKVADDGKPLVGDGSMMLGVRPTDPNQPNKRADVLAVAGADVVKPGDGGLSCYSDTEAIKIQPRKCGLWSIEISDLPTDLLPQPAGPPHYHIEANRNLTLDQLQQLLADTRDLWQRVDGGTGS